MCVIMPTKYDMSVFLYVLLKLLSVLVMQYERMKGVQSSGVMLIYWMLALLCATVTFRSKILQALAQVSLDQKLI